MFDSKRFDFEILSVHRLGFSPSERFVPKKEYGVLAFRTKGNAQVIHGKEKYDLNRNDLAFIPKDYEYKIATKNDEEVYVVHFSYNLNDKKFSVMHSTHFEKFLMLFKDIFSCWNEKKTGYVYKVDSLFSEILYNIEIQSREKNYNSVLYGVQRAIDEMNAKISDSELSIEKIADIVGYCPSYLRRVFRKVTGYAPNEYLNKIRLEYSCVLLESGYYSVEQVSDICGFGSSKYFSTTFKKAYGYPPSKLIKEIKDGGAII